MQVTGINSYTYSNKNYKPSFKGWTRSVYPTMKYAGIEVPMLGGLPIYRNNTWFFRNKNAIPKIIDGVVRINNDTSHVNTRIYGCSNGSEPYSMYMYLVSKYNQDVVSKFLPFKAFDIDEYAIAIAKEGEIPVDYEEFFLIQMYTHNKFNEFFDGRKHGIPDGFINLFEHHDELKIFDKNSYPDQNTLETGCRFRLNKEHTKNIEYSVANIVKDCENIEQERTFLSASNMLPYLEDNDILKLFKTLGKRLPQNSCIALSGYDFHPFLDRNYSFDLMSVIEDNGFSNNLTGSEFLFKKL